MYNEEADVVRVFYGAVYEFIHVICAVRDKCWIYNGNDSTLAKIIYYGIFCCLSDGYYIWSCEQLACRYGAEVKDVMIMFGECFLMWAIRSH